MTIDDLTLDTTQSIDIKADIGDVFRSVLHRLGEGITNRARRIDADDAGAMAGRPLVPRSRQRHRPSVGTRAGDQAAGAAGTERPHVHVVPGAEPPRSEARTAARRNACGPPPPRDRLHRPRSPAGRDHRLEAHPGRSRPGLFRARTTRNGAKCPTTTSTACGKLCPTARGDRFSTSCGKAPARRPRSSRPFRT